MRTWQGLKYRLISLCISNILRVLAYLCLKYSIIPISNVADMTETKHADIDTKSLQLTQRFKPRQHIINLKPKRISTDTKKMLQFKYIFP